jgi:hypothetical protein
VPSSFSPSIEACSESAFGDLGLRACGFHLLLAFGAQEVLGHQGFRTRAIARAVAW